MTKVICNLTITADGYAAISLDDCRILLRSSSEGLGAEG